MTIRDNAKMVAVTTIDIAAIVNAHKASSAWLRASAADVSHPKAAIRISKSNAKARIQDRIFISCPAFACLKTCLSHDFFIPEGFLSRLLQRLEERGRHVPLFNS
jgi:hypothetical protein